MTFPTPYMVGWHTHSDGAEDAHGNPVTVYTPPLVDVDGDPVDGTPVAVMGWAPTRTEEPNEARIQADIDLFVPPTVTGGPKDVVDLPEGAFEVVGWPEDWSNGPFGFTPGKVVKLKRTAQ